MGAGTALASASWLWWRAPGMTFFTQPGEVDHGYALALGLQVSHGATPGVDFFTQYGPMIAVQAALSWQTGSPWLAEVIGWIAVIAAGIGIWTAWAARAGGMVAAVLVAAAVALFVPKFPVGYFVFWPALVVAVLGAGRVSRWRAGAAGLATGLAGLYRVELGLALSATAAITLAHDDGRREKLGAFVVSVALPWLTFALWLAAASGRFGAIVDWADFQIMAVRAKAEVFSLPLADMLLGGGRPAVALAIFAVVIVTSSGLVVNGWIRGTADDIGRRAEIACLAGLCLTPQALHRTDEFHLLHVAPTLLAGLAVAAARASARQPWIAALGCGLALIAVGSGGRRRFTHYQGNEMPVSEKLRELETGTPLRGDRTLEHVGAALKAAVGERGTVLVPSIDTRIYVFAERPWAGLVPHFAIPLSPDWETRALAALERNPPAAVVWQAGEFEVPRMHGFEVGARNPQVTAWLRRHYPLVVFLEGGWEVRLPAKTEK